MAAAQKFVWSFPASSALLMRIEKLFLIILAVFVYIFTWTQMGRQFFAALVATSFFVGIYIIISYGLQKLRGAEEKYNLTKTHLHLHKKTKRKSVKAKVALKDISRHKLDHTFLGGYVITKKGEKHLLFFNSKKESMKFDKWLKKHIK